MTWSTYHLTLAAINVTGAALCLLAGNIPGAGLNIGVACFNLLFAAYHEWGRKVC